MPGTSGVHGTVTPGGRDVVTMVLCRAGCVSGVVPSAQVRHVARTLSVAVRAARRPGARGHGHIADSVVPADITRSRLRRSEGIWRCRQERTVKPSAQPTLVRTQHLPPSAETAPWLRKRAVGAVFFLSRRVSQCVTVSRRVAVSTDVYADGVRAARTVGAHRRLFHGRPRTAPACHWIRSGTAIRRSSLSWCSSPRSAT